MAYFLQQAKHFWKESIYRYKTVIPKLQIWLLIPKAHPIFSLQQYFIPALWSFTSDADSRSWYCCYTMALVNLQKGGQGGIGLWSCTACTVFVKHYYMSDRISGSFLIVTQFTCTKRVNIHKYLTRAFLWVWNQTPNSVTIWCCMWPSK